jgi:recombination protein RecT
MMTTAITKFQENRTQLRKVFNSDRMVGAIRSLCGSEANAKRFAQVALAALAKSPDLQKCTPVSWAQTVLEAAQLGFDVGIGGYAWPVPFGDKCTLVVGYQGYVEKMYQSGIVNRVYADVVYEQDEFAFRQGTDAHLHHTPSFLEDRGERIGAYAGADLKGGGHVFVVLPWAEIEKIRNSSKAKGAGPWTQWLDEMAKKSALRRLRKVMPSLPNKNRDLDVLEEIEHRAESGKDYPIIEADFLVEEIVGPNGGGDGRGTEAAKEKLKRQRPPTETPEPEPREPGADDKKDGNLFPEAG